MQFFTVLKIEIYEKIIFEMIRVSKRGLLITNILDYEKRVYKIQTF